MISFSEKKRIFDICKKYLEEKINLYDSQIRELRESATKETKSTSGDKYETGRSMLQIEIENAEKQKGQIRSQLQVLLSLETKGPSNTVGGTLIEMEDETVYYISVGIGKLSVTQRDIWVISRMSPIAQQFTNKKAGDQVNILTKTIGIRQIL